MQPQPQYPPYPPQPQYPQQPYPPQPQYPQQPAPPAPAQPAHKANLDSYFDQPSEAGGPSFKFKDRPNGTSYAGIVARPITDSDVRVQTNPQNGQAQTYKDGRPKEVLVVPMLVQPSPEYPEGRASWWVSGQARDELMRAMNDAGAPTGPPEAGAVITVTKTGERPIPGFNPKYLYQVVYQRPDGAAPTAATPEQAPQAPAAPQQAPQAPAAPQQVAPNPAPEAPQAPPAQGSPAPLSDEQAALLAKLTGDNG